MLAGLSKYDHGQVRQRGSSPQLQVMNTALMSAQDHRSLKEARQDGDHWGRVVESCVDAQGIPREEFLSKPTSHWLR